MYPVFHDKVTNRLGVSSPLDISLSITYTEFDRTGTVTAKIKNTSGGSVSGAVHFAIVESHIAYSWEDMDSLHFVMRDMLPDENGESVTIAAGDSVTKTRDYTIDGGWNDDNCDIVVFVQASDKTIYQGAEIAVVNDPYMQYYGMKVVETSGNSNRVAEPGERVVLRMSGKNMGDGTYTGGASVSTSDAYLTIDSTDAQTVSITRAEVDTVIHTYISIAGGCPDPHEAEIVLDFGSRSDTVPFVITTTPGIDNDVESGTAGWTHCGMYDDWQISDSSSTSPTHSWWDGTTGYFFADWENNNALVSPFFVVTPDSAYTFYHKYAFGSATSNDRGYLDIDNGSGYWQTVDVLTGTQSSWTQASYALTAYNGQSVRMRYRIITGHPGGYIDWWIDDILMNPQGTADVTPPSSPWVTKAEKTGSDVKLYWNPVTTDTSGLSETMGRYIIYRNTSPDFIPGSPDSIGGVAHPDTEYTDTDALTGSTSYYYLIKAVDAADNRGKKSNMAYAERKVVTENATATDKNWTSLPWNSNYSTVSDLTDDLSPAGDPLIKVTNLRDDQLFESWLWDDLFMEWSGTNFAITPGRAYEVVTMRDTFLLLVGCNDPAGEVSLNENPATTDKNWVSIPYNAVYATVSDITDEYSPSGDPLIKVTNLRDDQFFESWLWDDLFMEWSGSNFAIETGRGYEMVTISDTTWNPTEHSNESKTRVSGGYGTDIVMRYGVLTDVHRTPVWATQVHREAEHQASVSHIVRAYIAVDEHEDVIFTAYRPDQPYDVLTEQLVGSGIAQKDDMAAIWFDAGNFQRPWQDGEKLIIIIEATKDDQGYYAITDVTLDAHTDIQSLGEHTLVPIPEKQDNVIGYSLYREGERLVDEVIVEYAPQEDVTVRAVIEGGHETVYGLSGVQNDREETPIAYTFGITPNPFSRRTKIAYALPEPALVDVAVYDVVGREVIRLADGRQNAGYYTITWDGADGSGHHVASGIYFVTLNADAYTVQEKVLIVR